MRMCFECGLLAEHDHHVVPRSAGGTKTIPLCVGCHGKVHGHRFAMPSFIKKRLSDARRNGIVLGRPRLNINTDTIEALNSRGLSTRKIASEVGLSKSLIHRYLAGQR